MPNRFISLSDVILNLVAQMGLQGEMHLYSLCAHWEEIVGPQIARHTTPERLRSDRLILCVDSAPWMNQLTFLKKEIIGKTNRFLQKQIVNDLFLKLAPLPKPDQQGVLNPKMTNQNAPLTAEEVMAIESTLTKLRDTETRKKIAAVLRACQK